MLRVAGRSCRRILARRPRPSLPLSRLSRGVASSALPLLPTLTWSCFISPLQAAFATNPTQASFRSYLTELSFRRHLRELHRPPSSPSDIEQFSPSVGHLKPSSSLSGPPPLSSPLRPSMSPHELGKPRLSSSLPGPASGFRFANRVSISIRTPSYSFRDFGIFSLVTVPSPSRHPMYAGDKAAWSVDEEQTEELLAGVWFIGLFGRWWHAGSLTGGEDGDEEEETAGVVGIRALDREEPSSIAPSQSHSPRCARNLRY